MTYHDWRDQLLLREMERFEAVPALTAVSTESLPDPSTAPEVVTQLWLQALDANAHVADEYAELSRQNRALRRRYDRLFWPMAVLCTVLAVVALVGWLR
jgi:hypothetical protein